VPNIEARAACHSLKQPAYSSPGRLASTGLTPIKVNTGRSPGSRKGLSHTIRAEMGTDGMIMDRESTNLQVTVDDLRRYRALAEISRASDSSDIFES